MTINKLHCIKCGHEWIPRIEGLPKECPKCKSTKWDKLQVNEYTSKSVYQLNYDKKKLLEKLRLVEEQLQKINPKEDTPFNKYMKGEIGIHELYDLEKKFENETKNKENSNSNNLNPVGTDNI